MTPAKVTTHLGKVFFVPQDTEILEVSEDGWFSETAQNFLTRYEIRGTEPGFRKDDSCGIRRTQFYEEDGIREGTKSSTKRFKYKPAIKLRDSTKFEPVSQEGMERYQRLIERM